MSAENNFKATTLDLIADDAERIARRGIWILSIGLGIFLVWATIAPLDEGVPSPAVIAIETQRKAVQHLTGGIVTEVHVREGQYVNAGDLLYKLDKANARANFENVRQRYLSLRAIQGRLEAERSNRSVITLHSDLETASKNDPLIGSQIQMQQALLTTRRQGLNAEIQALNESIQGQRAVLASTQLIKINKEKQLSLLQEELQNTRVLVMDGYVPRNKQLELERNEAEIQASLSDLYGRHEQALRTIEEYKQKIAQIKFKYMQEIQAQLGSVNSDVLSEVEKMHALSDELDRTEINAPVNGQVVGMVIQTIGGVIQPGQKLLDLVPNNEQLVLEARIAPHLIDKVHSELIADVRFNAFAHSPQLVVEGKVKSVSQDLLTDNRTGVSYFLARVVITDKGMKSLGERKLQAGMTAEVIIKTGERTLFTYLLHPLTKRLSSALKEE